MNRLFARDALLPSGWARDVVVAWDARGFVTDVVAVSAKHRIVTLKGPKGNLVDLKVEDPEQFANIRKGDQVKAVYTEALAISVDPAVKK